MTPRLNLLMAQTANWNAAGYGAYTDLIGMVTYSRQVPKGFLVYEFQTLFGRIIWIAALSWQDARAEASRLRDHDPKLQVRQVSADECQSLRLDIVTAAERIIGFSSVGNQVRACQIGQLDPPPETST